MEYNGNLSIGCHIRRRGNIHESHLKFLELAIKVVHVYRVWVRVIGPIEIEWLGACVDRALGLTDRSDTLRLGGEKPKGQGRHSTNFHRGAVERRAQIWDLAASWWHWEAIVMQCSISEQIDLR